jgi:hypothetical protein
MARRATRTTRDSAKAPRPRQAKATGAQMPETPATSALDPAYELARTPLGADLRRLRAKIIESGEPLLSWAAIEKEVADRRGGVG